VAGGPVGGWFRVAQPVHAETGAGDLLGAAVAEQDVAGTGGVAIRMRF